MSWRHSPLAIVVLRTLTSSDYCLGTFISGNYCPRTFIISREYCPTDIHLSGAMPGRQSSLVVVALRTFSSSV